MVVLFILAGLFLPSMGKEKVKGSRITCTSNLRQIGLAFRMWSNDHGGQFPWDVTSEGTSGGTHEFVLTSQVWRHFRAISNELNIPKPLVCGDDKERTRTADWNAFTDNSHLSYFIGLDGAKVTPQAILSGDRNLAVSNRLLKGEVAITPESKVEWTTLIHNRAGNILFADGSVQQVNSRFLDKQLQSAFLSTTQSVLRFAFPQ